MRVAIMFDNLGPYHVARLEAVAHTMDVLAVEVRSQSRVYAWRRPDLPPAVTHVNLLPATRARSSWHELICAIRREVSPFAPDVVALPGWSSPAAISALAWAMDNSVPAVVMSDSNRDDMLRLRGVERIKQSLATEFSAALCSGDRARDYLVSLGMPADAVFLGYDVVDNDYFAIGAAAVRAGGTMPETRKGVRLDARWRGKFFLASTRFIAVKNLAGLLDGYAAYRAQAAKSHEPWPLVLLGDGPLRGALEAKIHTLGLEDSVHMPGFVQYDVLPQYYGSAGAFVLASTMEPWGLVVNEAMASGLPVAVSRRCGSAQTLVTEGENGFTFEPEDPPAISHVLWQLATHPDLPTLGATASARIADWRPERFMKGLLGACEYAVSAKPKGRKIVKQLILRAAAAVQTRRE